MKERRRTDSLLEKEIQMIIVEIAVVEIIIEKEKGKEKSLIIILHIVKHTKMTIQL